MPEILFLLATHSWKERNDRDPNKYQQLDYKFLEAPYKATHIHDTVFLKGIM